MRRRRTVSIVCVVVAVAAASVAVGARGPDDRELTPTAQRLLQLGYPVYCGGSTQNLVALTFDDGPGPFTRPLLDTLDAAGVRATFFDLGRALMPMRRMLRRELALHEVGDHTWTHPDLRTLSPEQVTSEMFRTKQVIAREGSGDPTWLFRPPYGAHDQTVDDVARRLRMVTVIWSVSTNDTGLSDPAAIADNVEAGERPGSIVLLHENNNHGATVAAMPRILERLAVHGLRPVTLGELLEKDPPTDRQLRTGPYGCGPTVWSVSPSDGSSAGGAVITITGDQLKLPRDVTFGGRPARIVDPGDGSRLRVIAPPGTGTVDVTLSTHFGSSPTSALDRYTYR